MSGFLIDEKDYELDDLVHVDRVDSKINLRHLC